MRASWLRSLVMLLALALANGNAHAALHLGRNHAQSCGEEHGRGGPPPAHDHDRPGSDITCCCDCLGCTSIAVVPAPTVGRADLFAAIRYEAGDKTFTGRTQAPEPDPPEPATPI